MSPDSRNRETSSAQRGSPFSYGVIIVAAFSLIQSAAWGTTQGSFGVFVTPLTEDTGWSRTTVSAAASTLLVTNFVLGVVWGRLSDRWSIRGVIAVAGSLMGLGFFLTSTSDSIWQFYLFYGFIAGAGLGGTAGPLVGLASRWFDRRRGLAIGIGFAGVGLGTAILPILSERLISHNDWRFAFRVLSFIVWGAFLAGAIVLREPRRRAAPMPEVAAGHAPKERAAGAGPPSPVRGTSALSGSGRGVPLSQALRFRSFWFLVVIHVLAVFVLQMILVHLVPRALDVGISSPTAATFLPALGVLSVVGKLAGGAWGDRIGSQRVFIAAVLLQAAALIWLINARQVWAFYLFAAAFGLGYGAWTPQLPVIAARIFGARHMGAIYGAILAGAAVGGFAGPATAGFIFDTTDDYLIAFVLGAGAAIAAAALTLLLSQRPQGVPTVAVRGAEKP